MRKRRSRSKEESQRKKRVKGEIDDIMKRAAAQTTG